MVRSPERLRWADLPTLVRSAVQTGLHAEVVRDETRSGGFSPGMTSVLWLSTGRQVFAKAISAARDPRAPSLYRREIMVMQSFSTDVPAPGLLWSYDDGNWVVLVLDFVAGHMPSEPWDHAELERVMDALERLSLTLTPTPVKAVSIGEDLAENFSSWRTLAADPARERGQFGEWAERNLGTLVDLEERWEAAAAGDSLLHADLRADNILVSEKVVQFVDWPYAVVGAAWVDALLLLTSVAAGGVDPAPVWSKYGPAQTADSAAVNAVLAAVAGDFLLQSTLPAPPLIPTLRAAQLAKGDAALQWLQSRIT